MLVKSTISRFSFFNDKNIKQLLIIGFSFRALLFLLYLHVTKVPDSFKFMELTELLLDFNLKNYTGERSLGYPLFMFFAFGSWKLTLIYQFMLGIITSVIWYKTLLSLQFTNKLSFRITLFLQSFLYLFFYEATILVESLTLFLISVIFYFLVTDYLIKKSIKLELLMGFILGYLVLVKPFFAFLPFLIYGFTVLKNFTFKKIINPKIIILIFPIIAYFGWSYVNKINTGYFVSTTYYGLNISQNCVYFAEKAPKEYDWIAKPYAKFREISIKENEDVAMSIWYAYDAGEFDHKKLSFADLSNELGKYGKETIKNNPKEYWKQVITRSWLDFWKIYDMKEFIVFPTPFVDSVIGVVWNLQIIILTAFKIIFLLLVPFYIFKFFRDRKIGIEILIVITVFSTSVLQAVVTYGTNSRYCFPFEYLMIILVLLFFRDRFKNSKQLNTFLQ